MIIPPRCVSVQPWSLTQMGYKSFLEWKNTPNHLYIGRENRRYRGADESKWHNPYHLKDYGTRRKVKAKYEEYIRSKPSLMNSIGELNGKVMGCWCKPSPCHGDVLLKIFNEIFNPEALQLPSPRRSTTFLTPNPPATGEDRNKVILIMISAFLFSVFRAGDHEMNNIK